jgi:lysophospholipase L1-like esterase/pimeloyl-ACP methyl ester carboxylesterase
MYSLAGLCRALVLLLIVPVLPAAAQVPSAFPLDARRILFLGDSITHDGRYVAWIETQLRLQGVAPLPEMINIGLSSETCSGLSEPDHPFPRPDVHERLERALQMVRPDVVVACYGMNDGIFHPYSPERFAAYRTGIERLIEKVHAAGAKLVLLTPPPFDPLPLRGTDKLRPAGEEKYAYFAIYENYDEVLRRYGQWLLQQKQRVAMVVDLHAPLAAAVAQARQRDERYTLSPDGIHPNAQGHQLLGQAILQAWGVPSTTPPSDELLALVTQRSRLLHDAWLTAVGHQRPGIQAGLPLEEAQARAAELERRIAPLVAQGQQPHFSRRASSGGTIHQVHYPAVARVGQLRLAVDYYLWIPDGVQQLRGIVVHQHGCGRGAALGGRTAADDLHWQALARKWDCALLGSSYEPLDNINCRLWCDPRNGSGDRFLQALADLAQRTGHDELTWVPWCLWGHSGGGFWASLMQTRHPERIVAIFLRSGTAYSAWTSGEIEAPTIPPAAYQVPVLGNPGLKEKEDQRFRRAWEGLLAMQEAYRRQGAWFELAPDPRTGHECGDCRYLAIPFFDFWLEHRLPPRDSESRSLRPVAEALPAWKARMADKLEQYVRTGGVQDVTPPPPPRRVRAARNDDGSVTVTWEAEADLESGIRGFVIYRDGQRIAQVPEAPAGRFGRPLFQGLSYHDTPEEPLRAMQFVDRAAPDGAVPNYRVQTVNSLGLESEPASSR